MQVLLGWLRQAGRPPSTMTVRPAVLRLQVSHVNLAWVEGGGLSSGSFGSGQHAQNHEHTSSVDTALC